MYGRRFWMLIHADHWETSLQAHQGPAESLWRKHMHWLYLTWLQRCLPRPAGELALKTDLYDEAVSASGLLPHLIKKAKTCAAMDVSFPVAKSGQQRAQLKNSGWNLAVVTDILNPGFRNQSFELIFSNSTLDHFSSKDKLDRALLQLSMLIKPDGILIITLDNTANPLIFIRNHLPYKIIRKMGFIPYFMGKSYNRLQLERALKQNGFEIAHSTTLLHAPRLLFIRLAGWFSKNLLRQRFFLRFLRLYEGLQKLPTRDLTGYYAAIKAVKQ